jgi:hypothetical protein
MVYISVVQIVSVARDVSVGTGPVRVAVGLVFVSISVRAGMVSVGLVFILLAPLPVSDGGDGGEVGLFVSPELVSVPELSVVVSVGLVSVFVGKVAVSVPEVFVIE